MHSPSSPTSSKKQGLRVSLTLNLPSTRILHNTPLSFAFGPTAVSSDPSTSRESSKGTHDGLVGLGGDVARPLHERDLVGVLGQARLVKSRQKRCRVHHRRFRENGQSGEERRGRKGVNEGRAGVD